MCGIGFIKRLENDAGELGAPILPAQIDLLVNSLEYRGNDAAGVALIDASGEISVYKDHEPAWTVTSQAAYREFIAEKLTASILTALVHTRKATKGSPYRNDNNHPLIHGAGVVVHNGMIHNDDYLFKDLGLERGAETDSDILRAILDQYNGVNKNALKALNKVGGSVASAMCHPSDPTKLLLLRSGNPLVLADDGQHLYGASDKRAIYRAARPWVMRHGFPMQLLSPGLAFLSMPNDSGCCIGSQGLEWHDEFRSSAVRFRYQSYADVYSPNRSFKREHQRSQSEGKNIEEIPRLPAQATHVPILVPAPEYGVVSHVRCPNQGCKKLLALNDEQQKMSLRRLECPGCHTNLEGAVKTNKALQKATN